MHEAIVCIGSNIPGCRNEMRQALLWLGRELSGITCSGPYQTPPEGCFCGTEPYLNAVCRGFTPLSSTQLMQRFKAYEQMRGRTPEHKAEGKIIIDIDLVIFDGATVNEKEYFTNYFRRGYDSLK